VKAALAAYVDRLARGHDVAAAVIAAAEADADPWDVVAHAGLLARCRVESAPADLSLLAGLRVGLPDARGALMRIPAGAPYPVLRHPGRKAAGAFDTPPDLARRVVAGALAAAHGPVRRALDPACGPGAFLVALAEAGVPDITGTDLDPLALHVARIAVPRAHLAVADGLAPGDLHDVVVGNPPFVPPERQDKALRRRLREAFPWLAGRFDLAVPFAAAATDRVRPLGALALVLPASALTQPYGAPLRRRWLAAHRVVAWSSAAPFPGASVAVATITLRVGDGPASLPSGLDPSAVLALPAAPLDPTVTAADLAALRRVRARSVPLGDLCVVDTGVVAHLPGGSREHLLHDGPGEGRVPYADAREFFAGRRRWLAYAPDRMHRAKRPALFEPPKLVVQRIRGRAPVRVAVDRSGTYVGHTCTVVVPRPPERVPLDRLRDLVASPLVDALVRIERGDRLDLYPRDVAGLPVPTAWLADPSTPLEAAWGLDPATVARLLDRVGQRTARRG